MLDSILHFVNLQARNLAIPVKRKVDTSDSLLTYARKKLKISKDVGGSTGSGISKDGANPPTAASSSVSHIESLTGYKGGPSASSSDSSWWRWNFCVLIVDIG